jgi:hypothetical protein
MLMEFIFENLNEGDYESIGKAKRIREILSWALENDPEHGEKLVLALVNHIQGIGGYRETSHNFVGHEAIENARLAFQGEGFELAQDGDLRPTLLENLCGTELTEALTAYVRRAEQGISDAALITGTSKDLVEATAAHILKERYGSYNSTSNFPTLLGQAFSVLGLATPGHNPKQGEPAQRRVERALFDLACAINGLRNKEGTGHGRPWLPNVKDEEAKLQSNQWG